MNVPATIPQINDARFHRIIDEYSIDVKSTSKVLIKGLNPSTNIFEVHRPDLVDKLFIIDTPQGRKIACHPHIVGDSLKILAFEAALEAIKAINELAKLSKADANYIVFENVLRAASGYELHTAFKVIMGRKKLRNMWIRPRYMHPSYRSHKKEASMSLNIIYTDFDELPHDKEIIVLKPDTEATGKTGQISIKRLVKQCREVGSSIHTLILYGFISMSGLKLISETTKKHGIELMAFAIEDITDLAFNGYDMTLYGVDESYWEATGKIRELGSIVDIETLDRFLPEFIPGSDQPGDWSNRQTTIHTTKKRSEKGEIKTHLQNSIKLVNNLLKISNFEPWQQKIAEKELKLLSIKLKNQI
jgi:hypothetical protein